MEEKVMGILLSGIYAAYQDTGRDKVCRIFIPGDSRMFDKFWKVTNRHIKAGWEVLKQNQRQENRMFLEEMWFHRYLQYQTSVSDAYHYVLESKEEEAKDGPLSEELAERTRGYAADCGARKLQTGEIFAMKAFYRMVIQAVRLTITEITPRPEKLQKVDLQGTDEEIRARVIYNLENEKLDNDEMWWHIRYCIDHEIRDYTDLMSRVAKHKCWKAWVRQAAAEYNCRFMEIGEVCERLLSGLSGKLFYWIIAQFADTKDERLKECLREYAEYYTGQEMLKDISLVKMQDRGGVGKIRRYLERMKHVPERMEDPDSVLALGSIREVELLEELDRLLDLMMRENFRDRTCNGLQAALVSALSNIAVRGRQEYVRVMELLDGKVAYYQEYTHQNPGKPETVKKKLAALIYLREDVCWRSRHFPGMISAIDISSQEPEGGTYCLG
jgi:hypothetical protein